MNNPLIIGLTGGIGSGKSTVGNLFLNLGVPIIDVDQINRQLLQPDTPTFTAIKTHFGSDILTPQGHIDTSKLKHIIFNQPHEKVVLESILHPQIRQKTLQAINNLSQPLILVEIPLLTEIGKPDYIDVVVVCDCTEECQIKRVQARDGMCESDIKKIMHHQASRKERKAIADVIINTDVPLEQLQSEVKHLKESLLQNSLK